MLGSGPYRRVQGDMDHQIHHLEKEAYFAVLRDFKAQSDAISWDKESLITELRKELRVSDDEHREVLVRVNNDEIICRIREWRKTGGHQALSTSHPINDLSSTTPVSRKKQRTTQSVSTHTAPPSQRGRKPRQIKAMLGDYDAVHVRRGDILKTRKDRFGVVRSRHPHVERDTRPECMLKRIAKWVPSGRTLFIASNERKPGYFSPLGVRYRLAYSSNYTSIVDPVIENNYQLFMLERLILMGAKTFINTFKSDDSAFSLSDDPKKNTGGWMKVVRDEDC